MTKVPIRPQSLLSKIADYLMLPVMYLVQLNLREVPQRTHFWNNIKLKSDSIKDFDHELLVSAGADKDAKERWWGPIPVFHIPILGGWDEFVVLEPVEPQIEWYVGWIPFDTIGLSQIKLTGPVRLLIGPRQVNFFGVNKFGQQIAIKQIGKGVMGKAGEYSRIPLL